LKVPLLTQITQILFLVLPAKFDEQIEARICEERLLELASRFGSI
jgi:hypothetical protein